MFYTQAGADWVKCGGSTVPIPFEGSRERVAWRSQNLLVEGTCADLFHNWGKHVYSIH